MNGQICAHKMSANYSGKILHICMWVAIMKHIICWTNQKKQPRRVEKDRRGDPSRRSKTCNNLIFDIIIVSARAFRAPSVFRICNTDILQTRIAVSSCWDKQRVRSARGKVSARIFFTSTRQDDEKMCLLSFGINKWRGDLEYRNRVTQFPSVVIESSDNNAQVEDQSNCRTAKNKLLTN